MATIYYCSRCHQPTQPRLYEPGAGASCCEEAELMITFCPSYPDKCAGCEKRPLTETEQRELTETLYEEEHADDTPGQRQHARWLEDS